MKKQVLSFKFNRVIVLAGLVSVMSLSSFTNANATSATSQSTIQYVGTDKTGIVFNAKYDNPNASKFDLIIKNDDGEILYAQQFKDKNFEKKIVLAKEPGEAHLTFIIKGAETNYSQSFDISTTSKVVEEVIVKSNK